jgi:hypothetical protein
VVKPDAEAAYDEVERELARAAAEFGFPHAYLAVESLTGPKEVWFFNGWESEAEQRQVDESYAGNAPLVAAFETLGRRKAALKVTATETFASYRRELSRGEPWTLGMGRFLTIVVNKGVTKGLTDGTVFEAGDGRRFVITAAFTREESEAQAAAAGQDARVFAVRPYWSGPASEWVARDPEFWQTAPPRNQSSDGRVRGP